MFNIWGRFSIQAKVISICSLFVLLLAGILWQSLKSAKAQKFDGLVINMAGRQRMLTQAMTKAAYSYIYARQNNQASLQKKALAEKEKMEQWFDATLSALKDGGRAPLGDGKSTPAMPRCDNEGIRAQIDVVRNAWVPFRKNLALLTTPGTDEETLAQSLEYVGANNTKLRGEMNKVVKLFENQSKEKLTYGRKVNIFCFLIGLVVTVIVVFVFRASIIKPLNETREVLEALALGDTSKTPRIRSRDEIGAMGVACVSLVHATQAKAANAKEMNTAAGKGAEAMEKMTHSMKGIRESSEKTSQIIRDINEIAFQTNLLALNAAVEAARAGNRAKAEELIPLEDGQAFSDF